MFSIARHGKMFMSRFRDKTGGMQSAVKAIVFMPFLTQGTAAATGEAGAGNTGYGWFETGTVSLKRNITTQDFFRTLCVATWLGGGY